MVVRFTTACAIGAYQTSLNLRNYSIEFEQLLVSIGDLTVTKLVLPTMQSEACKTNI
jgi:hypothetical protein